MTDRELLELAAKADGIDGRYRSGSKDIYQGIETGCGYTWDVWCPLDDDGDALRLAVKLGIDVNHGGEMVVAETVTNDVGLVGVYRNDRYSATRRAITRAAAEIGKGMK